MYKIVGADGKEYGPISAEVLRLWISQGRANSLTRVLPEGSLEWKALSELPEFAADLAAKGTAAAQPPPFGSATGSDAIAAELTSRDYQLQIGCCISRGWELVKKHFWLTVGATLLIHIIATAVGAVPLIGLALSYVFVGGLDLMFLKLIRGEKAELGDAFSGFNLAFGPLALFGLVASLLAGVGFLLCILPGIYLTVCWFLFTPLIILDKRLDFWQAMEVARKVVSRHWWQLFGFALVCFLIMLCGALVCGVGIFLALPIIRAATVYAYEDIFGTHSPGGPAMPVMAS
jgi:hypothetical protein